MLWLSDGRISGTARGTIVLHISPGTVVPDSVLRIVRDGDIVACFVEQQYLGVRISEKEIVKRIAERRSTLESVAWKERNVKRGYRVLYERCVNQAEEGVDFDFLAAAGLRSAD